MLGNDFQFAGDVRHITHRIGDGKGHPFQGSLRICCVKRNVFAIMAKDKAIYIRNLRGYSEHIYYPASMADMIMKRRSVRELTSTAVAVQDGDTSAAGDPPNEDEEPDENETSLAVTPFSFIDMQPTDICKISGQNALAITDVRYFVHILDLDAQKVVKVFGRGGFGVGEFASPTSICTARIHTRQNSATPELFYFVGDSLSSQRVKVFTADYSQLAQMGGLGPAPGQFRDIISLSCFNPNLPDMHSVAPPALGSGSTDSADASRSADPTHTVVTGPATSDTAVLWSAPTSTAVEQDKLPDWYRGVQSLDDLENMLYDDEFTGNFLLAQRKAIVYSDNATLDDTEVLAMEDMAIDGGSFSQSNDSTRLSDRTKPENRHGALPMESPMQENKHNNMLPMEETAPEDPNAEKIYDLLYITRSKKLDHMVIKENKNPALGDLGYFVSNSVSPTRQTFSCMYDLLRAQKALRLTFGGDRRQFIYVAVCDQGNYRVQVLRFYWTESFMYRPELQLAYVVGGAKKRYVELFDPVSVQYSPSGELAVCDGATNKIHLFSPHLDIIKSICVPFVSFADYFSDNHNTAANTGRNSNSSSPVKTSSSYSSTGNSKSTSNITTLGLSSSGSTAVASPGSSPVKMSAESLRRSGVDYLTYLAESEASTITFTAAEMDPEYRFQLEKKRRKETAAKRAKNERTASLKASQMEEYSAFMKAGDMSGTQEGATSVTDGTNTASGDSGKSGNASGRVNISEKTAASVKVVVQAIDPPSLPSALKSMKSINGGALTIMTEDGPGSLMSKYAVSLYPPTTPVAGASRVAFANGTMAGAGVTDISADPEAIEKKRRKNNRTPSCVCFTAEGQLVVGYKSGGVYVHLAYEVYPLGKLRGLQVKTLEYIVTNFLDYTDIQALRNCCMYLHNFTKELRLSWRLFPPARTLAVTRVISLFVQWSKIDAEGFVRPNFPLKDDSNCNICPRFLKLECEDNFCKASHRSIAYNRADLARTGAYIVYTDFLHFVSVVFDPRFLWKFELYIEALYHAYGADKTIVARHDAMKKSETIRAKVPETVRVLYFGAYLEVMTLLEEQNSGRKDIHGHKLFHRAARSRYVPKVDYALANLDRRMVIGPYEQYGRELDVPAKRTKGKKLISLKGMEKVERSRATPVEEHCAVFDCHSDKAAELINKLFS